MRKLKIITVGLFSIFTMFAINSLNAQVLSKGDFLFDAYIGSPKIYELTNRNTVKRFEKENGYLKYSGYDALGIRAEYMIGNRIGLGFDASFSQSKISTLRYFEKEDYEFQTFATMLTFNYHFLKRSEKFDLYGVIGIGIASRIQIKNNAGPDHLKEFSVYGSPLAVKLGLGARYFITNKIGVNLSVGYGDGGFINGGISIKF